MTKDVHLIRSATLKDLPALAGLLGQLVALDPENDPDVQTQSLGLSLMIKQKAVIKLLEVQGALAGMASLQFFVSPTLGACCGTLGDFVIDQKRTGQGWGEVLLEHLMEEASKLELASLQINIDPSNPQAMKFFARQGFCATTQIPLVYEL